jgi:hypothetical protein
MSQSKDTRRAFLSRLLAGSAVAIVGSAAGAGCAGMPSVEGAEGPVELVPMRDGLWYANRVPTTIPAVRLSPAVAPNWLTSKAFE